MAAWRQRRTGTGRDPSWRTWRKAVYLPDADRADVYDRLYAEYPLLHDYFGRGGNEVMHRLRDLRDRVLAAPLTERAGTQP